MAICAKHDVTEPCWCCKMAAEGKEAVGQAVDVLSREFALLKQYVASKGYTMEAAQKLLTTVGDSYYNIKADFEKEADEVKQEITAKLEEAIKAGTQKPV